MSKSSSASFLYVAASPYGGLASAAFFRSVLELRALCAQANVRLQLDLGGGEALASRGQAMQVTRFLGCDATHLLLSDGQAPFAAQAVITSISDPEAATEPPGPWLLTRGELTAALDGAAQARFADVRGADAVSAALLFESRIDPESRAYRPGGLFTAASR